MHGDLFVQKQVAACKDTLGALPQMVSTATRCTEPAKGRKT